LSSAFYVFEGFFTMEKIQKATGFASPAQGYEEKSLSLDSLFIDNPPATYYMEADSSSLAHRGIYPGTLLVVDRSRTPTNGSVAVIVHGGEFLCREAVGHGCAVVYTDGERAIGSSDGDVEVFGVVRAAVNRLC
jgi:SOS-response transcriptional repressor LexA